MATQIFSFIIIDLVLLKFSINVPYSSNDWRMFLKRKSGSPSCITNQRLSQHIHVIRSRCQINCPAITTQTKTDKYTRIFLPLLCQRVFERRFPKSWRCDFTERFIIVSLYYVNAGIIWVVSGCRSPRFTPVLTSSALGAVLPDEGNISAEPF